MRLDSQSIRQLRRPKPAVDPWRPHGVLDEIERTREGTRQTSRTVFLAGAECPFTCVFCDLWRYTTDDPTPVGAIPRQLEIALTGVEVGTFHCLKLYNASNFFDERAVPPDDHEAIARQARLFRRVVVECHPRLVDERCLAFRDLLVGDLEIALGLETIHPQALARLNKGMTVDDFARAADFAHRHEISTRAFVLIGAPGVPAGESLEWIDRTIRHAAGLGAGQIALIPVRAGNGALEELARSGDFSAPDLSTIELAFSTGLEISGTSVTLDLWDIEHHSGPACCFTGRVERLRQMNDLGRTVAAVECGDCGGSA